MRIALVHPYAFPSVRRGAERYLDDLAWALAGRGHEVDVFTGDREAAPGDGRDVTVRRVRSPGHPALSRRGIGRTETFGAAVLPHLLRRRYDTVHAMVPSAALAGVLARQPTVYSVIGHPAPGTASATRPFARRLMRAAVRAATATTALSQSSADAIETVFGRRPHVLPPGVRIDRFAPNLDPRSGPPRILFSAFTSDRRKGLDLLLAAFAWVLRRHPDARLQLSGAGNHEWALAATGAQAATVADRIDDLGPGELADVPSRYRAATVTVLPAQYEAFGLVLVESLACGTPVVGTDSGGMAEIIDRSEVGQVVPHGDVRALAEAICAAVDLARRPETARHCADHAARWGWAESVGQRHEDLYRSLRTANRS